MFTLRRVFIDKKAKAIGELVRTFSQFSGSNSLITGNQTTEKPFGSRLPNGSHLSILKDRKRIYVDKTPAILQLITERRFSLITRPRRFGKSLYLNTIKAIAEKDEAIKILAIGNKYEDLIKYPVIKFDFSNVSHLTPMEDYIG